MKCFVSLRSPTEHEHGGISFHMVVSSTRHFRRRTDQPQIAWLSRARGNPGSLRRISLDTRFRGYDGTQAGLFALLPKRVFSKESTKDTKVPDNQNSELRAPFGFAQGMLRALRGGNIFTVNSEKT